MHVTLETLGGDPEYVRRADGVREMLVRTGRKVPPRQADVA